MSADGSSQRRARENIAAIRAVHRATPPSERAVEVAHSFDDRDDPDLIGVGIMLIEDQVACKDVVRKAGDFA
jgi:hypothetical protein